MGRLPHLPSGLALPLRISTAFIVWVLLKPLMERDYSRAMFCSRPRLSITSTWLAQVSSQIRQTFICSARTLLATTAQALFQFMPHRVTSVNLSRVSHSLSNRPRLGIGWSTSEIFSTARKLPIMSTTTMPHLKRPAF